MDTQYDTDKYWCGNPFEGILGPRVLGSVAMVAFGIYCLIVYIRKRLNKEKRIWIVIFFDLSKYVIGQLNGWIINIINSTRNGETVGSFDQLCWYFTTFIFDEVFSVPLGLILGKIFTKQARKIESLEPIHHFGKYNREINDKPLVSWWLGQLALWCACVTISRFVGGLVVPLLQLLFDTYSPSYLLTKAVYFTNWSCTFKRVFFLVFIRAVIDLLHASAVDFINKFKKNNILNNSEETNHLTNIA